MQVQAVDLIVFELKNDPLQFTYLIVMQFDFLQRFRKYRH